MIMVDADALLKSMKRMIDAYEELKEAYKRNDRYTAVVQIENQIEGMRMAETVIRTEAREQTLEREGRQ